jgi:hypothetical protein
MLTSTHFDFADSGSLPAIRRRPGAHRKPTRTLRAACWLAGRAAALLAPLVALSAALTVCAGSLPRGTA